MNKQRRKTLGRIYDEIEKFQGQLEDLKSEIESVRDEEQEIYDNMPESIQGGSRGDEVQSAISALENALEYFGDLDIVLSSIDEARA